MSTLGQPDSLGWTDPGRAEPDHGDSGWVRHPSPTTPPGGHSQETHRGEQRRRASLLRDPDECFCHLSLWLGSKPQWPCWEVGLGEGRDGKWWVEDFQASEFCPPSVREHENKKQLWEKKEISKRSLFPFSLEADLLPRKGEKITSPHTLSLHQAQTGLQSGSQTQETLPTTSCAPAPATRTQRPSG